MAMSRDPFVLRACLILVRLSAVLVPQPSRAEWRAEWDAEIRHRWALLDRRHHLDWRTRMDLFRRVLGSLPDAAWLRRQFTVDAELVHDVRHGARMLRKSPLFTVSAVLILALGIGGTVSIVTLLDTLLFRPLIYDDADRVVTVWQRMEARPGELDDVSPGDFLDWRERSRSFTNIAAAIPYSHDYTGGTEPEVVFGQQVTEGYWDAAGVKFLLGRGFLGREHVKGAPRVAVLGYGFWQRHFGGNPAIVNSSISLDGEPYTVVGVLPKDFNLQLLPRPGELGVWTPKIIEEYEKRTRGSAWWNVVARLAPGVTIDQAQSEMTAISTAIARENPRTNMGRSAAVVPLREHLMGDVGFSLYVMLGAVLLVLAIGCANVASLLLARGIEREREFAIRAALGAGRARLVRQLVAESLLLSMVAALAGVGIAYWMIGIIVSLAPAEIARLHDASIDGRMLLFAAALTTMTAVGFGILPAWQFSRPGRDAIRERHSTGARTAWRRALVGAEVALALMLLTSAGLLIRSFERLLAVDPGFSPRQVVALQVFAWDRNGSPDRSRMFFDRTLARLRSIPGVQSTGAVSAMPFISANINIKSTLDIDGRPQLSNGDQRIVYVTVATPGYFETMSIPLREGRLLEHRDSQTASRVAVISDALRRREWPDESPIGRYIKVQWEGRPVKAEIVGVVSQIRHDGLDRAPRAEVFLPLDQSPFASMTYVVRGTGSPKALVDAAKREIWAVDPLQTFYDTPTVQGLVEKSVVRQRFSVTIMTAFAIVALVLCATGIYAIVSVTTSQRTREIGVRMALGADRSTIRRMVLREGTMLVGLGVVGGLVGAALSARFLRSLLFEVRPGDPLTFAIVCALLVAVGLAACYLPARRATRVDPLVALRVE
jgi:putative ABC transport system permease protein